MVPHISYAKQLTTVEEVDRELAKPEAAELTKEERRLFARGQKQLDAIYRKQHDAIDKLPRVTVHSPASHRDVYNARRADISERTRYQIQELELANPFRELQARREWRIRLLVRRGELRLEAAQGKAAADDLIAPTLLQLAYGDNLEDAPRPAGAPVQAAAGTAAAPASQLASAATVAASQPPMGPRLRFLKELPNGSNGMIVRGTCDDVPCIFKLFGPFDGLDAHSRELWAYRKLAAVQGSLVPKLLACGRSCFGVRWIALRLIEGQPLSSLPHIPPEVAAAAMRTLQGVQAAYPRFIHNDIRLENILLVSTSGSGAAGEAAMSEATTAEAATGEAATGEAATEGGSAGCTAGEDPAAAPGGPAGGGASTAGGRVGSGTGASGIAGQGIVAAAGETAAGIAGASENDVSGAACASSTDISSPGNVRCVLLDFGSSGKGDAAGHKRERDRLRSLLRARAGALVGR